MQGFKEYCERCKEYKGLHNYHTDLRECIRCNDNGCPACNKENRGSKYNPEPY